jgi:hypothetical protein
MSHRSTIYEGIRFVICVADGYVNLTHLFPGLTVGQLLRNQAVIEMCQFLDEPLYDVPESEGEVAGLYCDRAILSVLLNRQSLEFHAKVIKIMNDLYLAQEITLSQLKSQLDGFKKLPIEIIAPETRKFDPVIKIDNRSNQGCLVLTQISVSGGSTVNEHYMITRAQQKQIDLYVKRGVEIILRRRYPTIPLHTIQTLFIDKTSNGVQAWLKLKETGLVTGSRSELFLSQGHTISEVIDYLKMIVSEPNKDIDFLAEEHNRLSSQ